MGSSSSAQLKPLYQLVVNNILAIVAVPLAAVVVLKAAELGPGEILARLRTRRPAHIFLAAFLPAAAAVLYLWLRPRAVYLVDYACFRTNPNCRVPFATFLEHSRVWPGFDERSVRFMTRLLERSGLGEETCLPYAQHYIPPSRDLASSRAEAELVIFSAIDDLVRRTGLKPKDIDILVVNCSLFSPTPSLSAMIINKYKLRSNIRSFNLSGMGCSAGLISIDLARDMLQVI